jgi:hypothetical protein
MSEQVTLPLPIDTAGYKTRELGLGVAVVTIKSLSEPFKLKEEHRLRVFENRVLMKIFGPKRDEVTGEWRKLHNEELHILYSFPNIIRQIK